MSTWQGEVESLRTAIARIRDRKDREIREDYSLERMLHNNRYWGLLCVTMVEEMGDIALRECQPMSRPHGAIAQFIENVRDTQVAFDTMVRETRTEKFALVMNIGWSRMCVEVVDQFSGMIERRKTEMN